MTQPRTARAGIASTQGEPPVLLRRENGGGVVTLSLNRPEARNSLSLALLDALSQEFDRLKDDDAARVVVLAAEGAAFSAGHDLKELRANADPAFYRRVMTACAGVMTRIVRLPLPVIARVHGMATAAGCQLVASCDLAVAGPGARFCTPGVHIGLFCSTPMVALSRNVAPKRAMEMLLTGEPIDAQTALAWGLVNRVAADGKLDEEVMSFARAIAAKSPLTLAIGKRSFYAQAEMSLDDAYAYASEVMVRNMLARDAAEGIDAFLAKRPPTWCGA